MSDFNGSPLGDDVPPHAPVRLAALSADSPLGDDVPPHAPVRLAALSADGPSGSTTTYCYRTALGVRGATTNPASIPVGAEVERTTTG